MALSLLPLALFDLPDTHALAVVLVSHALAAATQDTSIDTWAVQSVPPGERGALNGWMQVGMLGARALFGGGAVLLAQHIGQRAVVALLIGVIAGPALLAALFVRDRAECTGGASEQRAQERRERLRRFRSELARLARRRSFRVGLGFTVLAGAGFEGLTSLAGPLLLDHGADESAVGGFFLVPAVALMAGGALAGGRASDRFGRRRVTALGEALAALSTGAIGLLVWSAATGAESAGAASGELLAGGPATLFALFALLYVAAGVATAGLYAMLMDLCEPELAATQFCTFMAAVNLCMVWSAAAMGRLHDHFGYGPAAVVLGCVSLLALPLLLALPSGVIGADGR